MPIADLATTLLATKSSLEREEVAGARWRELQKFSMHDEPIGVADMLAIRVSKLPIKFFDSPSFYNTSLESVVRYNTGCPDRASLHL
jgi:hypothetical protein